MLQGEEARKTGISPEHKPTDCMAGIMRGWNESMGSAKRFSAFVNRYNKDFSGQSDVEIRYYQAVTGKKIGFAETMEIGRKIWNLERASSASGRHRDQEKFFPYVYKPGAALSAPERRRAIYRKGNGRQR